MLPILLFGACRRGPQADASEAFRNIQVHEARIDENAARLAQEPGCEAARDLSAQLCAESEALCALARGLSDQDAESRCAQSADACVAARERAEAQCATPRAP